MFRQPFKLTNVTALPPPGSSGQRRTFFMPGNIRVHNFTCYVTQGQPGTEATPAPASRAQIIAAIQRIRLVVGTVTIRDITADQLLKMQDILGYKQLGNPDGTNMGAFTIYFSEPKAATVLGEEASAWDLRGIAELQIWIDLNMPPAGTAFDVRMEASIDSIANVINGQFAGRIIRASRFTDQLGGGRTSYFLLPRTRPFSRLWLFPLSGVLPTRVILRRNQVDVYDMTQTAALPELASNLKKYDKTPFLNPDGTVKDVWPIILNPDGQITNIMEISPADQLELITEMPTSGQIEFLIEQQSIGVA